MFTKSSPLALAAATAAATAAVPAADDPTHPFFGQGGSYVFDPATGQTTLLARSGQATPATTLHPSDPAPE